MSQVAGPVLRNICRRIMHTHLSGTPVIHRCYGSGGEDNGDLHGAQPNREPAIPPYEEKIGEPLHMKKARLRYQSRKRGMLENGLILGIFAHKFLELMNEEQLTMYDRLINLPSNDWEIFYWATGIRPTPQEFDNEVMAMLKDFVKNEQREDRTLLPNLH